MFYYILIILSKLDLDHGLNIKNRAQDRNSLGVARQSQMRNESDNECNGDKP